MGLFRKGNDGPFISKKDLTMHWDVEDPFMFVSHHTDDYPQGNAQMAPPLRQISGRNLGRDYQVRFGFRMYNGKVVPGFPKHAHWGYETLTLPMLGWIDHFDSTGSNGRYGFGDVQWVSAPAMFQHSEMYPLVNQDSRNPNDITQIFVNLPLEEKNIEEPSVNTVWKENIPIVKGEKSRTMVICGEYGGKSIYSPSTHTWARKENSVRILRTDLEAGGSFVLDPAPEDVNRNVYLLNGKGVTILGEPVKEYCKVKIDPTKEVEIKTSDVPAVVWVLEGKPIGQKMASFGPITLSTEQEVRESLNVLRRTEFESWPWDLVDKANPVDSGRFLRRADGTVVVPPEK